MGVSKKNGTPKSSNFNRVFHYKSSILGFLETSIRSCKLKKKARNRKSWKPSITPWAWHVVPGTLDEVDGFDALMVASFPFTYIQGYLIYSKLTWLAGIYHIFNRKYIFIQIRGPHFPAASHVSLPKSRWGVGQDDTPIPSLEVPQIHFSLSKSFACRPCVFSMNCMFSRNNTPPKFNIAPEKWWLED